MGILASLHEEHKARQLRLKRAAFKAVTTEPNPPEPEPAPAPEPEPVETPKTYFNISEAVIRETCDYYQIRPKHALSNRHEPEVVRCRHVIAYILYDITSMTNPQIGVRLSRDPTTILHAIRKIKNELPALQPDIDEIERRIRQGVILHGEREKKW